MNKLIHIEQRSTDRWCILAICSNQNIISFQEKRCRGINLFCQGVNVFFCKIWCQVSADDDWCIDN